MTSRDWHVPAPLLAQVLDDPRTLDDWTASSLEAHLMSCAACRRRLTAAAPPAAAAAVAASWAAIADRVDQPRSTLVEQLLHRLGVGNGTERLLTATPAVRAAGLLAVGIVALAAIALSLTTQAVGTFLMLSPLVPLAAVAATFAPAADPAGEAGIGTPLHGAGLVLRRAAVVLGASFGVLEAVALALPGMGSMAAAWVLPAIALALGALALGTWLRAEVAVGVLAAGWLLTVWSVSWAIDHRTPIVDSATFSAAGQAIALAVAVAAAAVAAVRRDRYATLEAFR